MCSCHIGIPSRHTAAAARAETRRCAVEQTCNNICAVVAVTTRGWASRRAGSGTGKLGSKRYSKTRDDRRACSCRERRCISHLHVAMWVWLWVP